MARRLQRLEDYQYQTRYIEYIIEMYVFNMLSHKPIEFVLQQTLMKDAL